MKEQQEITKLRYKHGLSQSKFAIIFPCSVRIIQEWDQNRTKCPPAMLKLAKLLLGEK